METYDPATDQLDDVDSLTPIVIPFSYKRKLYALKEATAATVVAYRNSQMKGAKLNSETGKPERLENTADADLVLVQGCLFERMDDGKGLQERPCAMAFVKTIEGRFFARLVAKAKYISRLEGEETEESLLQQRDAIDEKLAKMTREGGDGPKGGHSSTESSSNSVMPSGELSAIFSGGTDQSPTENS